MAGIRFNDQEIIGSGSGGASWATDEEIDQLFNSISSGEPIDGSVYPQALFLIETVNIEQVPEKGAVLNGGITPSNLSRNATVGEVGFGVFKHANNNRSWYCTFTLTGGGDSYFTATFNSAVELTGADGATGEEALVYNAIEESLNPPTTYSNVDVNAVFRPVENFNRTPKVGDYFIMINAFGKLLFCRINVVPIEGQGDQVCGIGVAKVLELKGADGVDGVSITGTTLTEVTA